MTLSLRDSMHTSSPEKLQTYLLQIPLCHTINIYWYQWLEFKYSGEIIHPEIPSDTSLHWLFVSHSFDTRSILADLELSIELGWPWICSNLPISTSWVPRLKVWKPSLFGFCCCLDRICYVSQAGLGLCIFLFLTLQCWDDRQATPYSAWIPLKKETQALGMVVLLSPLTITSYRFVLACPAFKWLLGIWTLVLLV